MQSDSAQHEIPRTREEADTNSGDEGEESANKGREKVWKFG
jgi:hypothetical protein